MEAKADLWALVQDAQGVELEWLKMKTGESASLYHSGELTITCSSGNKLIIKDKTRNPLTPTPTPTEFQSFVYLLSSSFFVKSSNPKEVVGQFLSAALAFLIIEN